MKKFISKIDRINFINSISIILLFTVVIVFSSCTDNVITPDETINSNLEIAIGEQMIVEATLAAHFVAIAEQAGITTAEINSRLKSIADNSVLTEFWITDENGNAYLTNENFGFSFNPDPKVQPQAYVFWDLITGRQNVVNQSAQKREVDNHIFKYVGVAGIDKPRIVQVGINADELVTNSNIETEVGKHMVVEALIAAHLADVAEKAGLTTSEINSHLRIIASGTVLDEFWITDSQGHAYLRNADFDFTFNQDRNIQPQAYVFWDLITGAKNSVIQNAQKREVDDQVFKYVGVAGIDKPRIVQVGIHYTYFE